MGLDNIQRGNQVRETNPNWQGRKCVVVVEMRKTTCIHIYVQVCSWYGRAAMSRLWIQTKNRNERKKSMTRISLAADETRSPAAFIPTDAMMTQENPRALKCLLTTRWWQIFKKKKKKQKWIPKDTRELTQHLGWVARSVGRSVCL